MLTVLQFWSYGGLKLTELISMEIPSIKHKTTSDPAISGSGDQWLSPDELVSHTFSQRTYNPLWYVHGLAFLPSYSVQGLEKSKFLL